MLLCNSPLSTFFHMSVDSLCGTEYMAPGDAHAPSQCSCHFLLDPKCADQDAGAQEKPPAQSVSSRSASSEVSSTIYTETVQFLLQNNALQVKIELDSEWTNMTSRPQCTVFLSCRW